MVFANADTPVQLPTKQVPAYAPLRLLISKGAIPAVAAYYKTRFAEFQQWQDVSAGSDFEE